MFRALGEVGADILAENIDGSSPLDYAERRFAQAETSVVPDRMIVPVSDHQLVFRPC